VIQRRSLAAITITMIETIHLQLAWCYTAYDHAHVDPPAPSTPVQRTAIPQQFYRQYQVWLHLSEYSATGNVHLSCFSSQQTGFFVY
jgi:hypothetical protein